MPVIVQRQRARQEIVESFVYLEERSGLAMAERFFLSVRHTFDEIAVMPKWARLVVGSAGVLFNACGAGP